MKEEKKAIEMLKDRQKDLLEGSKSDFYSSNRELYKEHAEAIDTILNLIEKLQKENLLLSAKENMSAYFEFKREFISKDKIREKIKDLQKDYNNDVFIGYEKITGEAIKKLKELLEEE